MAQTARSAVPVRRAVLVMGTTCPWVRTCACRWAVCVLVRARVPLPPAGVARTCIMVPVRHAHRSFGCRLAAAVRQPCAFGWHACTRANYCRACVCTLDGAWAGTKHAATTTISRMLFDADPNAFYGSVRPVPVPAPAPAPELGHGLTATGRGCGCWHWHDDNERATGTRAHRHRACRICSCSCRFEPDSRWDLDAPSFRKRHPEFTLAQRRVELIDALWCNVTLWGGWIGYGAGGTARGGVRHWPGGYARHISCVRRPGPVGAGADGASSSGCTRRV